MAKYFSLPDDSMEDLSIMVIEKIYRKVTDHWRQKESHLIEIIRLLAPDGLNTGETLRQEIKADQAGV